MTQALTISQIANRILESDPDPVVRFRIQRDVLKIPASKLTAGKIELDTSPWVQQLIREQRLDGGWGRFHSRDSRSKQKIVTTEFGVARGLALGLDACHPIFCRTVDYLAQLLQGKVEFPDRAERNDRWPIGVQLFVASTLAQLKPNHPFVDAAWDLWSAIAIRSFSSGEYNPEAEIQAHRDLTGATVKDSYLLLNNKYTLTLLSARPEKLPDNLQNQLLHWLWHHPHGIRYLGVPAARYPVDAHPGVVERWFVTQELLSRFSGWSEMAADTLDWLWSQQGNDGLWDFGPRWDQSIYFPLSPNWRKPINQKFDWTTRVLALLC
jgi:hypothetical protein